MIANEPAEALAGVLDIEQPLGGTHVPALWHSLYLLERRAHRDLGPDGHPTSGIPAPPDPGRRQMFTGGRVQTLRLPEIGTPAARTIWVARKEEKQGRFGPLTFVTVRHEMSQGAELGVVEEQDIGYRAPGSSTLPSSTGADPPPCLPGRT